MTYTESVRAQQGRNGPSQGYVRVCQGYQSDAPREKKQDDYWGLTFPLSLLVKQHSAYWRLFGNVQLTHYYFSDTTCFSIQALEKWHTSLIWIDVICSK